MDVNDKTWNPWHGCRRCSEGCAHCYMYFLDKMRGRDGSVIFKNKSGFELPIKKNRDGSYKLESGEFVRVCMTSDFFLEEADEWRAEAWEMIRERSDLNFSLLTKRAERIKECLPKDWGNGWDNVSFAVSCENQKRADERLPYLIEIPAKHKWISLKPFIGEIDLDKYLASGEFETVLAGGESYEGARPLYYDWVKKVYNQCVKYKVRFIFAQTGNVFIKDGREYKIKSGAEQKRQALRSRLQYPTEDIQKRLDLLEKMKQEKTKLKKKC